MATKATKTHIQNNILGLAVGHKGCPKPNGAMSNTDGEYVALDSGRHKHAKPSVCIVCLLRGLDRFIQCMSSLCKISLTSSF